jgi:LysM repeat protein
MFRLGIYRIAAIVACGLVAACAERPPAVAPAPPPAAVKPIYVVVARGQSLDRIAQTYRVAKEDIIAANQLKPPYKLKPGTVLAVPIVATEAAEPAAGRSKPGTSPRSVAKPDRATSASIPIRRRTKTSEQAVTPLDDPAPAQRGVKKTSPADQQVVPLDDPTPVQRDTGNPSASSVGASPDVAGPRISFPGPAP